MYAYIETITMTITIAIAIAITITITIFDFAVFYYLLGYICMYFSFIWICLLWVGLSNCKLLPICFWPADFGPMLST